MTSIKEMLEAEIKESHRFSRENFGMLIGDGFQELVREIVKSEQVVVRLALGVLRTGMSGQGFAKSVKEDTLPSEAVLENMDTFQSQLEFFYWGIQLGRKLEREEAKALEKQE